LSVADIDSNPHFSEEVRREAKAVQDYQKWKENYLKDKEKAKQAKEQAGESSAGAKRTRQTSIASLFKPLSTNKNNKKSKTK